MIKMNNLKGTENSHGVLPTLVDADHSEKKASISDFRELFLSTPESVKIFQRWYSKQNDPDEVIAFLNKLKFFSLSTSTIMALFLFMLYQKEEDIPTDIIDIDPDRSEKIFSESIHLFQRLLKVHRIPFSPKKELQAELAIRMLLTLLADVQLLTVYLVLQLHKLESMMSLPQEEQEEKAWIALNI